MSLDTPDNRNPHGSPVASSGDGHDAMMLVVNTALSLTARVCNLPVSEVDRILARYYASRSNGGGPSATVAVTDEILHGWSAIAAEINIDRSTLMRWWKNDPNLRALIHHQLGGAKKKARVWATLASLRSYLSAVDSSLN